MYSAIEIAKYVITYCMLMNTLVSNLQLQKILYYLQVYYLKQGYSLFREEIYAWQHGPVVPEVYYMFSGYGASKIQNVYNTGIDPKDTMNIDPIVEKLRQIDPWKLVRMTHRAGQPWDMVYNDKIDRAGVIEKKIDEVMTMKLIYPAVFRPFSDGSGGFVVEFPDLPGCVTEGKNLEEAIEMGIDAASGWILGELEDGEKIPVPSAYEDIAADAGQMVNMLLLDLDSYEEKYGEKAVRKNLTIPAWLNTFAERNHVNFSKILQDALLSMAQAR